MSTSTPRKRRIVRTTDLPQKFDRGFLDDMDRRFRPAQLVTLAVQELTDTLGGEDHVTPQQKMLIQRASWAHRRLQEMEAQYASGAGLDAGEWSTLTGSLTRCLQLLGLERRARPVPTLAEYIAAHPDRPPAEGGKP